MNKGCLQEWIERNKTTLSHFESLVFLANRQVHFFFFFKRIRGVALFCGQMFNQEQWFFFLLRHLCAHGLKTSILRLFQNERFARSTLTLPKLLRWVDLTILSLPTPVGWSLNLSWKKKRKRKERKNEVEIKFARLKTWEGSLGKKKEDKTFFGQISRLNEYIMFDIISFEVFV